MFNKKRRNTMIPPPPKRVPPTPINKQPSMLSNIGTTIVEGMAFGTGSSVAHNVINGLFGNSSNNKERTKNEEYNPCDVDLKMFNECLQNNNDVNNCSCEFYYERLKQCKQDLQKK